MGGDHGRRHQGRRPMAGVRDLRWALQPSAYLAGTTSLTWPSPTVAPRGVCARRRKRVEPQVDSSRSARNVPTPAARSPARPDQAVRGACDGVSQVEGLGRMTAMERGARGDLERTAGPAPPAGVQASLLGSVLASARATSSVLASGWRAVGVRAGRPGEMQDRLGRSRTQIFGGSFRTWAQRRALNDQADRRSATASSW